MRPHLPFALFVSLACGAFGRDSRGQTVDDRKTVLLVVAASARETAELAQVTTELLGRLAVSVHVRQVRHIDLREITRPTLARATYLARAFIDLRARGPAVLWFVDEARDRVLMRELDRVPGEEELSREELGHILETSTEGLLSGAEIGVPRAEVIPLLEAPGKQQPTLSKAPRARPWQGTLLYEIAGLSSSVVVTQGLEAGIFLRMPLRAPRLGIWLTAQYRFPVHAESTPVGARIQSGVLRALLALDLPVYPDLKLRFGLGAGADLVDVEPESSASSGVSLAERRLSSFFAARAAVSLELRLWSSLSIWSRIAADVIPTGTRYVFERLDGEDVVLKPWPVRPALAAGVGFP